MVSVTSLLLSACSGSGDESRITKVALVVVSPLEGMVYISRIPYSDEKMKIVDSIFIKNVKDSVSFNVPREVDRIYEIHQKNSRWRFKFIADASNIYLRINYFNGKSVVEGSPSTISLKSFDDQQNQLISALQALQLKRDSLAKTGEHRERVIDSLQKKIIDGLTVVRNRNLQYADTVANPAAFLSVYSDIDFDNNRSELQKLVSKAASRFPSSEPVQKLKQEVADLISIFENEYNIGDTLPSIQLPDVNGNQFSTASLKGKFYLLDFWATWCPNCAIYNKVKKDIFEKLRADRIELVSVALDDDRDNWENVIRRNELNWHQLIDEKMWRGPAVKTLKFDSVPFNFLVSPDGRVLAKAIKPDSLISTIERKVR